MSAVNPTAQYAARQILKKLAPREDLERLSVDEYQRVIFGMTRALAEEITHREQMLQRYSRAMAAMSRVQPEPLVETPTVRDGELYELGQLVGIQKTNLTFLTELGL